MPRTVVHTAFSDSLQQCVGDWNHTGIAVPLFAAEAAAAVVDRVGIAVDSFDKAHCLVVVDVAAVAYLDNCTVDTAGADCPAPCCLGEAFGIPVEDFGGCDLVEWDEIVVASSVSCHRLLLRNHQFAQHHSNTLADLATQIPSHHRCLYHHL